MKKNMINFLRQIDDIIFDNIGPVRVLFVLRNLNSFHSFIPLIEKLKHEKAFKISITSETNEPIFLNDKESQQLIEKFFISTNKALLKKWHYIFTSDISHLYFKRNATFVSVSHGFGHSNLEPLVSDKQISETKISDYWTQMAIHQQISLIFMNAKSNIKLLVDQNNNNLKLSPYEYLVTGLIKSDRIIANKNNNKIKTEFCKKYNLSTTNKNVFIYSHWTPKSLLNNLNASDIERLVKKNSTCNFVVNGHPLLWKNHDNSNRENELFLKLKVLEEKYHNLIFLPFLKDKDETTNIADVFIGDYSSFFIGACLADKPIIFFRHPDFVFPSDTVEKLYVDASISFSASKELYSALSRILISPDLKESSRKNVADYFLYQPGNTVNYIIASLKAMGRASGPQSKSWYKIKDYCSIEREKHFS